jgi:hypothetical protein
VAGIKPCEGSIAAVFSNGGLVAGHFDPSRLGKSMTVTEVNIAGGYMADFTKAITTVLKKIKDSIDKITGLTLSAAKTSKASMYWSAR